MPETTPSSQASHRRRPLQALRALRALAKNPDDTGQVFMIVNALAGKGARVYKRFRRLPAGRRLLQERPSLIAALEDREALRAMPEGSLGRSYLAFVESEQISADGLVEASMMAPRKSDVPEDQRWLGERLRDMHDVWHVVTGYGRDLLGEAALLSFTFAQTRNPGIGVIVLYALAQARGDFKPARGVIWQAFQRGRRSEWLPAQPWEELLALPLEEVRERLRIGGPPVYPEFRSQGAPAAA